MTTGGSSVTGAGHLRHVSNSSEPLLTHSCTVNGANMFAGSAATAAWYWLRRWALEAAYENGCG